jgi:hypothetical protein
MFTLRLLKLAQRDWCRTVVAACNFSRILFSPSVPCVSLCQLRCRWPYHTSITLAWHSLQATSTWYALLPLVARGHGCSEWMWFHLVCPGHGPRHCSWLEIENCLGMFVSWLTVVEVREFRVQTTCPHCLAVRERLWESEIWVKERKKTKVWREKRQKCGENS